MYEYVLTHHMEKITRRKAVRAAGSSLAAVVGVSGTTGGTAENNSDHKPNNQITLEDGRFKLIKGNLRKEQYQKGLDIIDDFNQALNRGYLYFDTEADQVSSGAQEDYPPLEVSTNGSETVGYGIEVEDYQTPAPRSGLACNRNDLVQNVNWLPPSVTWKLYLGDGAISDLMILAGPGTGSAALFYQFLVAKGYIAAAAVAPPVALLLGGVLLANLTIIGIVNDGDGVIMEFSYSFPIPSPTVVDTDITEQQGCCSAACRP